MAELGGTMVPGVKKVSSSVSLASVSIASSLVSVVLIKSPLSVPVFLDAASYSVFMVWRGWGGVSDWDIFRWLYLFL